ncbi:MAG: T9SS type A sorting domain-containing protein [Calditrichaceae bacterium]
MRKLLLILPILLLIFSWTNLYATSYLIFWVNDVQSNTITQGDIIAWEMDVATPGATVDIELYLDIDGSHTIDSGDLLLERFQMQDGGTDSDGPADSSATPDGIIYVNFGPFGFAPENYIMRVTDEDNSTVTNWFTMLEMSSPPATISGTVTIEGVDAPDALYENIFIGAQGPGLFSGLTDVNGQYTINLPVADADWSVEIFFENMVPGYISPDTTYEFTAPAGNTGSIDFTFLEPQAWVYGDLRDENGTLIDRDLYAGLENQTGGSETTGLIENGHFNLPAAIQINGTDSTNYFQLHLDSDALVPDYMVPQDNEPFPISFGDSLEKNLTAYTTDAIIYGYVQENGAEPAQAYQFTGGSDMFGYTETVSNSETGYFELHVHNGSSYWVGLQDDPDWGTPPPAGYVIEGGNWRTVDPGDTIIFNLVQTGNMLSGYLYIDPNDPYDLDISQVWINAWDTVTHANYGTNPSMILPIQYQYEIPVPDGVYNVNLGVGDNNYLTLPSQYTNISVSQDSVDTLHFALNYANAQVTVKLINAPIPPWLDWYGVHTDGEEPFIFNAAAQLQPDSTFHFQLCDGDWIFSPPFQQPGYDVVPWDTTLTIANDDTAFYLEFVYYSASDIGEENIIPQKYALEQNYPNPFNPKTTIKYQLSSAGKVQLKIYNILGQAIQTLVSEQQKAGKYQVTWDASRFPSGVYFYRIEAGDFVKTRRMLLIK